MREISMETVIEKCHILHLLVAYYVPLTGEGAREPLISGWLQHSI